MKAVMLSIQPKWCELIESGKKTVEVRKTKPKIDAPFKCYIYETQGRTETPFVDEEGHEIFKGRGQVICEFVCDAIFPMSIWYSNPNDRLSHRECPFTCLTDKEIMDYLGNGVEGYGWNITDLVIYDKPKELSEFEKVCQNVTCSLCEYAVRKEGYLVNCDKRLKRPPQSWCYCEEILQPLVDPKGKTITIPKWEYKE